MPEATETCLAIVERERPCAGELVDPALPVDLGDLLGDAVGRTPGSTLVLPASGACPRSSSRSTPCRGRGAGRCGRARRRRATASPSVSNVGPRFASSARWSAPLPIAASQARTSPRFLRRLLPDRLAARPESQAPAAPGRLAAAARRRRRRRPGTTSSARRRCPGVRVLRQFAMTPLAADRGNSAPGGQQGDRIVRNGGVRWGPLGSDPTRRIPRESPARAQENGRTTVMPEEGLEPPTRGL